jgi:hypothetical protein
VVLATGAATARRFIAGFAKPRAKSNVAIASERLGSLSLIARAQ